MAFSYTFWARIRVARHSADSPAADHAPATPQWNGGATLSELREISSHCRTLPTLPLRSAGLRGLVDRLDYHRHIQYGRFGYLTIIHRSCIKRIIYAIFVYNIVYFANFESADPEPLHTGTGAQGAPMCLCSWGTILTPLYTGYTASYISISASSDGSSMP